MGKPVKYLLISTAVFVFLIGAAIALVPQFIDVEDFKPEVEALVAKRTGYPLHLDGKISLSLFPWVGLSFTDLRLDNPESFSDPSFISIKNFQAQLKLLPLFSRNVEIRKFVIDQPEIHLLKNDKGIWNWQKPAPKRVSHEEPGTSQTPDAAPEGKTEKSASSRLGLQSLIVGECALSGGTVIIEDRSTGLKKTLSDLSITLTDVSFDKPINLVMQALLQGKPLEMKGSVGPLGMEPGKGKIDFEATVNTLQTMSLSAKGSLTDLLTSPQYSLLLKVDPFNPRKLFSSLGSDFPLSTSDPGVLKNLGFTGAITGSTTAIDLSQATIVVDDSSMDLALNLHSFAGPGLTFDLKVDSINLDRYLPAQEIRQEQPTDAQKPAPASPETTKAADVKSSDASRKTSDTDKKSGTAVTSTPIREANDQPDSPRKDYGAFRTLDVKGTLSIGALIMRNVTTTDLAVDIAGKNGLIELKSLTGALYNGTFESTGTFDVQTDTPVSTAHISMVETNIGPLLKDLTKKELVQGAIDATIAISMIGDTPESILATLNGSGDAIVRDGALVGIDLAQLARTIASGFTLDQQGERPKTDFAELHVPFIIKNGLLTTMDTTLKSPFIRANAHGDANLLSQELDLNVAPKIVGTIKGQSDESSHSGITVPILVGGTFEAPTFTPDLKALIKEQAIDEDEVKEILKTGTITPERKQQMSEEVEKAKNLFKGLFGN